MASKFHPSLRTLLRAIGFGIALAAILPASAQNLPAISAEAANVKAARALLPEAYRKSGVLKIAASTVYAPHSFFKEGTTEWTGHEVELFNGVAQVLGVKASFAEAPFQQLIAGVNSGRSDIALGDLGDNDLRQTQVDFIDYGQLTFQLAVDKGNPAGIQNIFSLCGRELGVVQGTTNIIKLALDKCSTQGKAPPKYVEFPDQPSKDQAIRSGRLPRVDIKQTTIARYLEQKGLSPDVSYVNAPEIGNLLYGAVVKKGNTELARAVLAAVQVLYDNGSYQAIHQKWNLADQTIKAPGINIGSQASNFVQPKP